MLCRLHENINVVIVVMWVVCLIYSYSSIIKSYYYDDCCSDIDATIKHRKNATRNRVYSSTVYERNIYDK